MLERKYNPHGEWYQMKEFGGGDLPTKSRKVARGAEIILGRHPTLKEKLGAKALSGAKVFGSDFLVAVAVGLSRFYPLLPSRGNEKAVLAHSSPAGRFDRSQIEATWPSSNPRKSSLG